MFHLLFRFNNSKALINRGDEPYTYYVTVTRVYEEGEETDEDHPGKTLIPIVLFLLLLELLQMLLKLTLSSLLPRFTLIVGDELIFPINEGMQLTKDKGVLDNVALSFTGKKALFQMIIEITAVVIALLHSRYIFELILSYSVCLPELYFVRCEFKEEISI